MQIFGRLALMLLLWPLLFATANGQDSGSPGEFHLNGVLISPAGRSALINGKVSREGDHVGRAEILSIEEKGVRLLLGTDEFTVLVGSSTIVHTRSANRDDPTQYRVREGDTLSAIAEQHVGDGVTMNQMMIALFEANPRAFDGNINRMRADAVLTIPNREAINRHTFETATAEVVRQTSTWRSAERQPVRMAAAPAQYGPVSSGETLSGIAAQLSRDGVTMNQMMIALFEANPRAFNGNLNLLLEDAVLRIPGVEAVRDQAPETATAEVLRHTELWRRGQEAQPAEAITLMTALNRDQ